MFQENNYKKLTSPLHNTLMIHNVMIDIIIHYQYQNNSNWEKYVQSHPNKYNCWLQI